MATKGAGADGFTDSEIAGLGGSVVLAATGAGLAGVGVGLGRLNSITPTVRATSVPMMSQKYFKVGLQRTELGQL